MKIAIVNDVHVGKPLMHGSKARSTSDRLLECFLPFLSDVIQRHKPDLLVNMGDLIRSETKEIDKERYLALMKHFQSLETPVLHLLGNHEIKRLQADELESVWKAHGFDQESFGLRTIHNLDIIWLGIDQKRENAHDFFLPSDQLTWLEKRLQDSTNPLLIFSHCAIDDHVVEGNFFYEALDGRKKDALFLKNQKDVQNIIHARKNVIAVFQAHLHDFHAKVLRGVPYITCPAMNDNICGPDVLNNNPEIYTIATIDEHQFTVKSYSREYCFAGYEQKR